MMKNFYKKLSFVMVMGISLSSYAAWNGDATAWTQGDGSEQNPFLIENEAQLSHLQQTVTTGETYQEIFPLDSRFGHGWQANAFDWSL